MLLRSGLVSFGFFALFLAACSGGGGGGGTSPSPTATPTPTASPTPAPCPTSTTTGSGVLICKSASTNTQGYYILLQTTGAASITESGNTTSGTASSSATSQLFGDLNANTPVVDIKTYAPCTKSASFGTTTTVTYEGYTTGDISCPSGNASPAPVDMIYSDVENVESSLGLTSQ
jgi:hypothetical protein